MSLMRTWSSLAESDRVITAQQQVTLGRFLLEKSARRPRVVTTYLTCRSMRVQDAAYAHLSIIGGD